MNYTGQKRVGNLAHVEEVIPVRDIVLRVRTGQSPTQVVLQPDGVELAWEYANGVATVRVPELALHAMVVFE